MAKQPIHYGATITYRPVARHLVGDEPDTRPVHRLPSLAIASEDTATARDRSLARACGDLESQGYRIEGVERFEHCARCQGTGKVRVKPRGWRRRTAPPWYLMRTVDCKDCPGERRECAEAAPAPCAAATPQHAAPPATAQPTSANAARPDQRREQAASVA